MPRGQSRVGSPVQSREMHQFMISSLTSKIPFLYSPLVKCLLSFTRLGIKRKAEQEKKEQEKREKAAAEKAAQEAKDIDGDEWDEESEDEGGDLEKDPDDEEDA